MQAFECYDCLFFLNVHCTCFYNWKAVLTYDKKTGMVANKVKAFACSSCRVRIANFRQLNFFLSILLRFLSLLHLHLFSMFH